MNAANKMKKVKEMSLSGGADIFKRLADALLPYHTEVKRNNLCVYFLCGLGRPDFLTSVFNSPQECKLSPLIQL